MAHGGDFNIHKIKTDQQSSESNELVYTTKTSAEATKKVLQLEELSDSSYSVTFPTLDDVFLKVTDSTMHQATPAPEDGIDRRDSEQRDLLSLENREEVALEVGTMINFSRQVRASSASISNCLLTLLSDLGACQETIPSSSLQLDITLHCSCNSNRHSGCIG